MDNKKLGSSILRAFLAERLLGYLTRGLVDVSMLVMLINDDTGAGIIRMLAIMIPVNFLLCAAVVIGSDMAHRKGLDLTGLETLRGLEYEVLARKRWFSRIVQWLLKSRQLIFWVGSWFYLDPDYVTLLIRRRGEKHTSALLRITGPSVLVAMAVWTPIYWAAAQGFQWAVWLVR